MYTMVNGVHYMNLGIFRFFLVDLQEKVVFLQPFWSKTTINYHKYWYLQYLQPTNLA